MPLLHPDRYQRPQRRTAPDIRIVGAERSGLY